MEATEGKLFSLKTQRHVWQIPLNMLPKAHGHTHRIPTTHRDKCVKKIISEIGGANPYKELKGKEPVWIVARRLQRICK